MTTLSRRTLLKAAAITPVAGPLEALLPRAAAQDRWLKTIGVQLYTVRDVLPAHPLETLQALDQIGYREVEAIQATLEQIWPALERTKLKPVSLHLEPDLFTPAKAGGLAAAFGEARRRGFEYVVYPYIAPKERKGLEGMRALAKILNAAGEKARTAGLRLCYHNHAFEFEPLEGTAPIQVLLGETRSDLVGLEMDVFWVSVGGHDPAEMLRRHAGRVPLMHLKDKAAGTPVQYSEGLPKADFKELGEGTLDFPAILAAAREAGVKHYFVEQDATPGDPVASLRKSYRYLAGLQA